MRRTRAATLLTAFVLSLACSAPAAAAAEPAPHPTSDLDAVSSGGISAATGWVDLGGVSMRGYCQAKGFADARVKEENVHGWFCVSTGREERVNLYRVCAWQHQRLIVVPYYHDYNDVYGLTCYGLSLA